MVAGMKERLDDRGDDLAIVDEFGQWTWAEHNDRLNRLIAEKTGQPIAKVSQDTDRNHWMSPEEARDYGIVGKIIASAGEL